MNNLPTNDSSKSSKSHLVKIQQSACDLSHLSNPGTVIRHALTAFMRAFQDDISKFGRLYSDNIDTTFDNFDNVAMACGLTDAE